MALDMWKDTFTVNTLTDGYQFQPDIIGLSNGNILVVWTDDNDIAAGGTGYDIMGQIYDPTGAAVGEAIFLNEGYGDGRSEYSPQVAATADGGFVLTYAYYVNAENDQLFRVFDADGVALGGDQQGYVIDDAAGGTTYSDFEVVYRPDGSSVFTYRRDAGTDEDLMYQVINADGSLGTTGYVRADDSPTASTSDPNNPTAAVLTDGRVIVAYQEKDGGVYGPEFAVIDTDGTSQTVYNNQLPTTRADDVAVAALSNGGFVITYREGTVLKAQLYDADLKPQGDPINLVDDTNAKHGAQVTTVLGGGFALGWIDYDTQEIKVQVFAADGTPGDLRAIDYGNDSVFALDLAHTADGRIAVTWEAYVDGNKGDQDVKSAILDPRGDDLIIVTDGTPTTATLRGSAIDGGDADDIFYGMQGNDDFSGKKGDDSLFGGAGDDDINGGRGADALWGSVGDDVVTGDGGADRMWGGSGDDMITGGGGNDEGYGGTNADMMRGGGGDDQLHGGKHKDVLDGGKGRDKLWGDGGRDALSGGKGNDKLWGGGKADTFVFANNGDRDVIKDFGKGRDTLELNDNLWRGNRDAEDVLDDFASKKNGNIVFDFGGGDKLVLEDFTNMDQLEDMIDIV